MKFIVLIYNDPGLVAALPPSEFNTTMRDCLVHADEMTTQGTQLQNFYWCLTTPQ